MYMHTFPCHACVKQGEATIVAKHLSFLLSVCLSSKYQRGLPKQPNTVDAVEILLIFVEQTVAILELVLYSYGSLVMTHSNDILNNRKQLIVYHLQFVSSQNLLWEESPITLFSVHTS